MKQRIAWLLPALLLLAGVLVTRPDWRPAMLDHLEFALYDFWTARSAPRGVDPRIVIVDVDERSLSEQGRWPWSRERIATLVDRLFDHYKVGAAGFDIVFSEPESAAADERLARALKDRKVVLGYYFSSTGDLDAVGVRAGELPAAAFSVKAIESRDSYYSSWNGYGANLPVLVRAAGHAGHFNSQVDADGVVRRIPMLAEHRGGLYPAYSLVLAQIALDAPRLALDRLDRDDSGRGVEFLELTGGRSAHRVPVDPTLLSYVPYRGARGSFLYVSATDVLNRRAPIPPLHDKIIVIGSTAPGLYDLRATPLARVYPGVEIHANMVAGILDSSILRQPRSLHAWLAWGLAASGGALIAALALLGPLPASLLALLLAAIWFAAAAIAWRSGLYVPVATPLATLLTVYFAVIVTRWVDETRRARALLDLFGQYVPAEVVRRMARIHKIPSMTPEDRELTILFCDIQRFMRASRHLPANQVALLLRNVLGPLGQIVHQHGGTIDKYIGDAIMVFWGAPLDDPRHASHAVKAALKMIAYMPTINQSLAGLGLPSVHISVGINTGVASVGDMGSEHRRAYTAVGHTVNLAARIEASTRSYGLSCFVGVETMRQCANEVIFREVDHLLVKGYDKEVTVYAPEALRADLDEPGLAKLEDELERWHRALGHYRQQCWDEATPEIEGLRKEHPDKRLYAMFLDRIAALRQSPPQANWGGAWVASG